MPELLGYLARDPRDLLHRFIKRDGGWIQIVGVEEGLRCLTLLLASQERLTLSLWAEIELRDERGLTDECT